MCKVRSQFTTNITLLINFPVYDDKLQPESITLHQKYISEVFEPCADPLTPDVVMNCLDLPQDGPRIKIPRQE